MEYIGPRDGLEGVTAEAHVYGVTYHPTDKVCLRRLCVCVRVRIPLHPLCQLDREDTSLTRTLGSALGRLSERIDAWLDAMLVL